MTVYDWAVDFCKERGMFPSEATSVVERAVSHPAMEGARLRWGDDWERYPEPSRALLEQTLKSCAVTWIIENDPNVWFRPLFDGSIKER